MLTEEKIYWYILTTVMNLLQICVCMLTIKNNLTNTHGHIGAGSKLDELVTLSMHYGHYDKQNSLNVEN